MVKNEIKKENPTDRRFDDDDDDGNRQNFLSLIDRVILQNGIQKLL